MPVQPVVAAVDVGGTTIKAGAVTTDGTILCRCELPTPAQEQPAEIVAQISRSVDQLYARAPDLRAIGIGIAGQLDANREILISSPNLPCITNLPLQRMLTDATGLPAAIENDANAAALGERWRGCARSVDNLVLLTIGTGIGSGLILNGRLWTGELGKGGELGHLPVMINGARCGCGSRGCLETVSSGLALVSAAHRGVSRGTPTSLQDLADPGAITPRLLHEHALAGDRFCRSLFDRAARYLGMAIAAVNNLLDIHTFVVGGGVSPALDLMLPAMMRAARARMFAHSRPHLQIIPAELGNDAGMLGAACLALQLEGSGR